MSEGIVIGIDFGTTNTSVAQMQYYNGVLMPKCFKFEGNNDCIKSLISYTSENNYYIGKEARNKFGDNLQSIKRKIVNNEHLGFQTFDKKEEDVLGDFLKEIIKRIENQLTSHIEGVVFGVPIGMSDSNKNIYLRALVCSGIYKNIDVAKKNTVFVSEPIAAALDFATKLTEDKKLMVFDFGGGTLDIIITQTNNILLQNEITEQEVLSKIGGLKFGGDDFDMVIFKDLVVPKVGVEKIKEYLKISSLDDVFKTSEGRMLMDYITTAKEELSRVKIAALLVQLSNNTQINVELHRDEFEYAIREHLKKIENMIEECLFKANNSKGIKTHDIDIIVMAGGSSLIPAVQETLFSIFGRGKVKVNEDPITSIARGLALRGDNKNEIKVIDLSEHSYGVKVLNDDGDVEIRNITNKNQKISDINDGKYYFEFELTDGAKTKNHFKINVCSDGKEIGIVRVPFDTKSIMSESTFKLHFVINDKLGVLEPQIKDLDRDKMIIIPIEENERINI